MTPSPGSPPRTDEEIVAAVTKALIGFQVGDRVRIKNTWVDAKEQGMISTIEKIRPASSSQHTVAWLEPPIGGPSEWDVAWLEPAP